MKRSCAWAISLIVASAAQVAADPPKGQFEVHELSLWICDTASPTANARGDFSSAFPPTVNSSRPPLAADATGRREAPVAMIAFYGQPTADLDVDLRIKSGSFLAHWPASEGVPNRLRWAGSPGVSLIDKVEDETTLSMVGEGHWFRKAREGDALYVRRGARSERFLAYDAELNLPSPVRLQGGPDKYSIINVSGGMLRDVLIVRRTPEGLRVAWLDELPRSSATTPAAVPAAGRPGRQPSAPNAGGVKQVDPKPAKAPAAAIGLFGTGGKGDAKKSSKNDAAPAKPASGLFGGAAKAAAAAPKEAPAPAPAAAAANKPAGGLFGGKSPVKAAPKDAPAGAAPAPAVAQPQGAAPPVGGVEVTLSAPLPLGSSEAAAATNKALAERLTRAGMTAGEVELFVTRYAPLLFEGSALVVACRIDPGLLDEKVPLSIFPEPTKIVRVAMVLVRNVDPRLGNDVEQLIAQLGDSRFVVRDTAEKQLTELGPLAFEALKKAINHSDMEVVIRAERILLNRSQQALGRVGATGEAGPAAAPSPAQPQPNAAPAAPAARLINGVFRIFGG
jgi:hypothetical protein